MDPEKRTDYSNCTAFISYRRAGGEGLARHLHEKLTQHGVVAFYDVDSLRNGRFDINLLNSINDCDNFILILSKDSLNFNRIRKRTDFVRREIEHALKHHKNIVPIMLDGFSWTSVKWLPKSMRTLSLYNGMSMHSEFNGKLFDAFVEQLLTMLVAPKSTAEPSRQEPQENDTETPENGAELWKDESGTPETVKKRQDNEQDPPVIPFKRIALFAGIGVLIAAAAFALRFFLLPSHPQTTEERAAYVYRDANAEENLYEWPLKIDGTDGRASLEIELGATEKPHSGTTCIRCQADTGADGWGGWMLLNGYTPEGSTKRLLNDGETPNQGEDLSGMTELRFYARGKKGGEKVEFFCCGFGYNENNVPQNKYNDSAFKQSVGIVTLDDKWTAYSIPLSADLNLSNIACGIGFVCSGAENGTSKNCFYLDDVRYCAE